jgi:putative tryptophan/tyrosine transport system substrate-binding protein
MKEFWISDFGFSIGRSSCNKIFSLALCLLLLALSVPAHAQQSSKIWRIGLFHVGLDHVPPSLPTLKQELKKLGYEEGKNVQLDWRNLPDEDAANATASEFVRNRVDLIVAFENQTIRAAKAATSKIPILILHASDPVADGFVKSMSRPEGNLTGFFGLGDMPAKRLELFKEIVPKLRRVLVLIDNEDPVTPRYMGEVRSTAAGLKLQLLEQAATTQGDIERVFATIKRDEIDGVFPGSPNLNFKFSGLMVRFASDKRLPLAVHRREWVEQGALFSYAHDIATVGPLAARYIDKILKGAKPGDLPVQEPSQFEFVINLKTAKSLGLTIPQSILYRADKVIK